MSTPAVHSSAQRYDRFLRYAKHADRLPPTLRPQPTSAWPRENVLLLEQYRDWLVAGGASPRMIHLAYLPMAGHVLGLNLKPHPQLDLDRDFQGAVDYTRTKDTSAEWIRIRTFALAKFRQFLRQQRGQRDIILPRTFDPARYCTGLPAWLVDQLKRYQHLLQSHWRSARQRELSYNFWDGYTRLWRWLFAHRRIQVLTDIKRQDVLDYIDARLVANISTRTINQELRHFRGFLLHLQDQDYHVPQALLHLHDLKEPDRLPRFLPDEQVRHLRDEFEQRVAQARPGSSYRDAQLDRAAFYLMWQAGLRLGEVEELSLADLDLPGRKLTVRQGKGLKDRTIYLTDATVQALQAYLAVRGRGATDHVFLYRNEPVHKDLLHCRIKNAGKRAGIHVSPHCLRHTMATQLLNAGCRVTSIQKLLGHRRLNSTMIYARVHDQTVAEDYYAAMAQIEKTLDLTAGTMTTALPPIDQAGRAKLLELADRLATPRLDREARLDLVTQMRRLLKGKRSKGAMLQSTVLGGG